MVSKSRIWGARRKALSGLKGLLKAMGLGVMTEGIQTHVGRTGGRVAAFIVCNAETVGVRWSADKSCPCTCKSVDDLVWTFQCYCWYSGVFRATLTWDDADRWVITDTWCQSAVSCDTASCTTLLFSTDLATGLLHTVWSILACTESRNKWK